MTTYVFHVWLLPNPPLEFEPDKEVWRDIKVDSSHTLATLHDAVKRWDTHGYDFITRDEDGISLRNYTHPQLYDEGPSWLPMDDDEIERFIEQAVPDTVPEDAKDRFRELQRNPPTEGNAADTTIVDLDPEELGSLSYEFDFGDGWEHYLEHAETGDGALDGEPIVVGEQGTAPSQYPDLEE